MEEKTQENTTNETTENKAVASSDVAVKDAPKAEVTSREYKQFKSEFLSKKLTNVKPWQLAGSHPAFGRGVGKRTLKKVFDTHGKILGLSLAELVSVEGVEANTAKKIKNSENEYTEFLQAIGGHYTCYDGIEIDPKASAKATLPKNAKIKTACAFKVPKAGYDICIGNPPYKAFERACPDNNCASPMTFDGSLKLSGDALKILLTIFSASFKEKVTDLCVYHR